MQEVSCSFSYVSLILALASFMFFRGSFTPCQNFSIGSYCMCVCVCVCICISMCMCAASYTLGIICNVLHPLKHFKSNKHYFLSTS